MPVRGIIIVKKANCFKQGKNGLVSEKMRKEAI